MTSTPLPPETEVGNGLSSGIPPKTEAGRGPTRTFWSRFRAITDRRGVPPPRWRLPSSLAHAIGWGVEAAARLTRTEPLMTHHAMRGTGAGERRLDGSKAVRDLGLPQTPLEEAIRRAVGWFKQHGYC